MVALKKFLVTPLYLFDFFSMLQYGCLREVYGTPFFFVNGFPLPDAGSALDYTEWRKVIDPLLNTHGMSEGEDAMPLVFVS